jgi:hypothetical protein
MTARRTDPTSREELYDTGDETALPGRLGYYLKLCGEVLWPLFQRNDRAALAYQARYRRVSLAVTVLGTLAVVAGSVELFQAALARVLTPIEGVLGLLAAAAVVYGLARKLHRSWLKFRYRAERLRLLKFSMFADPRVWADDRRGGDWEASFRREIERIDGIEQDDLESISHHERIPDFPTEAASRAVPDDVLRALAVYYRVKRLDPQIEYFQGRAQRVSWMDNPVLLPLIFFGSVALVLMHSVVWGAPYLVSAREASARDSVAKALEPLAGALLGLSLAIPAWWAGMRTYRSANEFARNRSRSLARENALREIAERLSGNPAPQSLFAHIAMAEYILAADQHEWLRLMLDAEWYG